MKSWFYRTLVFKNVKTLFKQSLFVTNETVSLFAIIRRKRKTIIDIKNRDQQD